MTDDSTRNFGGQFQAIGADRYRLPTSPFRSSDGTSIPVNTVGFGVSPVVEDTLHQPNGNIIKLANNTVHYVVQESLNSANVLTELCGIKDADNGIVEYALDPSDLPGPGIYLAAYNVTNSEGILLHQVPRYLQITPSLAQGVTTNRPLSIAEVRLSLRDYPASNTLLDEVEFSDEEIIWALTRPVDIWNSTPPDIGNYDYNNFPWRAAHLDGTIGELLAVSAHHYMRNELPYQSAGLSVNDKAKASNYLQLSENLKAKFVAFVERKKYELNIAGGFRFKPGPYGNLGY
jgi:hypothetical protein